MVREGFEGEFGACCCCCGGGSGIIIIIITARVGVGVVVVDEMVKCVRRSS